MRTPTYDWKQVLIRVYETLTNALRVYVVGGDSDILPWEKSTVIVPATTTLSVDTNLLSSFTRLDYICSMRDDPHTVSKSFRAYVQNNGGVLKKTVTDRTGGPLNVTVDVTDNAIDQFLDITNNESFAVTLTLLKSKL